MCDNLINDLFIKGFHKTNSKEMFVFLEELLPKLDWIQNHDEDYRYITPTTVSEEALSKTMKLLHDKYVSPISSEVEYGYSSIWNGAEKTTCEWHNDLIEGPNLFFLLYLNDIKPGCGGDISFRDAHTKEVTGSVIPKKYDIVIGSQNLKWDHKVGTLKCGPMDRFVANFGFKVHDLDI